MNAHANNLPRYITTVERGNLDRLLVAIPVGGARALTLTLRRRPGETWGDFLARVVLRRDRAWRRLYGGAVPARSFHTNARADSATGIPGVRRVAKGVRKGARTYVVDCIVAEVHTIPGCDYARPRGSRSRVFSLRVYGWDEAVALAAAWRAAMLQDLAHAVPYQPKD